LVTYDNFSAVENEEMMGIFEPDRDEVEANQKTYLRK
jgi:hypothetical protein